MNASSGKVLFIAYYYPPMAAAGSHRIMHFSRELQSLGWGVSVVSSNDFKRNRTDPLLLERIPSDVHVRRAFSTDVVEMLARLKARMRTGHGADTGSHQDNTGDREAGTPPEPAAPFNGHSGFFDYLTRLMKTPDSMLSFVPSAVFRALPVMVGPRPDVIFSSAPPYSCHLAALCLKGLFHVPWIADFRDPWAGNPFRTNARYPSLNRLNRNLESFVVQEADQVICNTHALEDAFRARYPHQDHFVTLTNGFDPQLLERFAKQKDPAAPGGDDTINLVHTGEVYGLRSPHAMIDALGEIRRQNEARFSRFRFSFYGKVDEQEALENHARAEGVENAFYYGGEVDHEEALRRCAESEMLLLLGVAGNRPEVQVPSKVFEYLAMKKPILSLSKEGGAIQRILRDSRAPFLLADLDDASDIRNALDRAAENDFDGGTGWDSIDTFSFDRLASRLSRVMTNLKLGKAVAE